MGRKEPFGRSVGLRHGHLQDFSDSLSTLDFSHSGAKGVGYARHRNQPKRGDLKVPTLPPKMVQALAPFAPLFSGRVFRHVQVLVAGAILAPGKRTVASALRAMGLDQEKRFHRYHRVLSRAGWSSRKVSRVLLGLLVETFVPEDLVLWWASMRPWSDATARRSRPGASTATLGALHPRNLREEHWPKMGLRYVVGGDPLGFEGMGFALP
jgi:DDE superfamily endonuclease